MKQQWNAAARELSKLHFSELWPGFHPYPFALYSQREVFLGNRVLPWDSRFVGNTAIEFEGQPLAIWNLELDPVPQPAQLAAYLVHEMFHAFQLESGESRFPDDLALLQYPDSPENMALRFREFQTLADVHCPDPLAALQTVCALRSQRETLIGTGILQEYRAETIEGMAEWIGLRALKQLDSAEYEAALEKCVRTFQAVSMELLDIRRSSYTSGVLLLHLALRAGIPVTHPIGAMSDPVFSILRQRCGSTQCAQQPVSEQELRPWAALYQARTHQREQTLRTFMRRNPHHTAGSFYLCGYDPMNLWRLDDRLYSSTFLELQDETGEKIDLFGESVLELSPSGAVVAYDHEDGVTTHTQNGLGTYLGEWTMAN